MLTSLVFFVDAYARDVSLEDQKDGWHLHHLASLIAALIFSRDTTTTNLGRRSWELMSDPLVVVP